MATGQISCRALVLTCLSLFITSSSFADNSVLNPQPNFAGVPGGGVTANASSCFSGDPNASQGAIGTGSGSALDLSGLGGKKKGAAAGSGECGATAVPSSTSLSCDSAALQTDGNFDPKKLEQKVETLSLLDGKPPTAAGTKNGGSLTCEVNQFNTIKTEMACVQNQGQLLAQQIGSLSQVYQQNITRMQKDDQAYKQREGDRQSQLTAIQNVLGGNKNSGTKGLLGEQADLQKLVNNTMPQDIAAALAQSQTVANQRAIILENIQKHTMSLTGDCFKTNAKAGYKCTPGGPDLSPENYIVCMYGKYAHVNPNNNQYVQGALADSNASAAQNTLQGILDQMTSETSLSWSTPTDATSAAATAQKPSYGNTIQDLINNFVSKTGGMTVNGISVSTVITNELQSCYLAAQAEVQSERTDPSSAISQAQFQQTQSETALKAGFDQKLEQYSEKWTEAMGVLSQQNLPLNLSNCKNQDITYEGNCLTDVQTQITALLNGSGSQAPFTMNVPAQFPDTQIPTAALQCRGINGCVTQLQALNDQVNQAKTTLTTGREAYETQARQSTDQFTQQVAALLNNQSAQLRKQLSSVNSQLQGLGVAGNISFPNIQGAQMQYETNADGSQGLPKMPDDVMKLIGGKMSPPMMDLSDNSNNDSSAMAEGLNKAKDSLQKVQTVRDAWEAKATECAGSQISSDFDAAVSNLAQCSDFCTAYTNPKYGQKTGNDTADAVTLASQDQYKDITNTDNLMLSQLFTIVQSADNQLDPGDSSSNSDNDDSDDDGSSSGSGRATYRTSAKAKQAAISKNLAIIAGLVNGCNNSQTSSSANKIDAGGKTVDCPSGAITGGGPTTRGSRGAPSVGGQSGGPPSADAAK